MSKNKGKKKDRYTLGDFVEDVFYTIITGGLYLVYKLFFEA